MSEDPVEPVVVPRAAASLIVLRPGPTVLMGMRGAGHRFMPNRLVFPGGAVDPQDHAAPFAAPLRPHVRARLEAAADPALAAALAIAAARELEEEAGLSLGTPPRLDALDYLCRAVTPPGGPVRFDARFLVVDAAAVAGTIAGSGELEALAFIPVAEALALDLVLVTRLVLGKLTAWLALAPELRDAWAQQVLLDRTWHDE